ncbi:flagellar hook-associated protein FlgK [Pannonibacter sp. Pt2]|uniref:Flagellar hook-associated protein 1 n=1 Tax=Pannonibacter anstelovis TaxID=3121537 RepID=A0ABU7ZVB6_9HYPH
MGLTSALNTALFGLSYNQKQIDLTAANVANAKTEGYTAKRIEANVYFDKDGNVSGILSSDIKRQVNESIQMAYWDSRAATAYSTTKASYTQQMDATLGTLEDSSSLPSLMSRLNTSLATLVSSPDSYAARQDVLSTANLVAKELNSAYRAFEDLRKEADRTIDTQVGEVNQLLKQIEAVEAKIYKAQTAGVSEADLLDERDRYLEQLTGYLDVRITRGDNNTVNITTNNGESLFSDGKASTLSFTPASTLLPGQNGNQVTLTTPGGLTHELGRTSSSGSLIALTDLRDETLVEAQAQLDEIASQLSLAFSNVDVAGTATTAGAETGFTLDVSGLQSGNTVSLSYKDSGGVQREVTFVAVKDPALLPLAANTTADPADTVFGIDISSGNPATYITQMIAALGATDLDVANNGSDQLRILGDTATNTSVTALKANITATGSSNEGLGLAVFTDGRAGEALYTGALESGGQKAGYARSIMLNSTLPKDSSKLVIYQTTPVSNSDKDSSRPQFLVDAMSKTNFSFSASTGLGTEGDPFRGSVMDFVNQVVAYQGEQAQTDKQAAASYTALTQNLAIRHEQEYSVDVDAELGFLIQLQNAYTSNARVMQAAREMFETLLNSI